ncbi:MAG: type II toxin-antitoxin system PemK/MazF family toxin [Micropruina sp.]|nr:type II toxin-antitoxin system PemK/MazF family toxin [Micropruina sp.]
MKRGEIWTVAGGVYAAKPRPALIIQEDLFGETTSVTVVPLTSTLTDAPFLRVRISNSDLAGLDRVNDIMVDKLTTIHRSNVHNRLGRLASEQLVEVEQALMAFLGLAR